MVQSRKRRVFFSFHHQEDSWRVNQIRNSWVTQYDQNSFVDAVAWESVKRGGDAAIKNWIDEQLDGTSVTVVLIGQETANRRYVRYEIEQSFYRRNGLLGIHIHDLRNQRGETAFFAGDNPFAQFYIENESLVKNPKLLFSDSLSNHVETYSWNDNNGYKNFSTWVEQAVRNAGRE